MTTTFWLLFCFAAALGLGLLITPIVMNAAGSLKLLDSPDGVRRSHPEPVPRVGGVAVYLTAALVATVMFARTSPLFVTPGAEGDAQIRFLTGVFLGSGLLFLTGLIDDVREMSASAKLAAQVAAALIAWYFGARLDTVAMGYGAGVSLGVLGLPLLVLWLVGATNAFNFIDGLNGLASGIAVVAVAAITVAGLALGNFIVLVPAIALGGALMGFMKFNFPRARIFLGDSGSMSVGFLIAALSLKAAENESGAVLLIIPMLALAVPLLDGLLAIVRRWLRRLPVSGADARHIHHRLLAMGVSPESTAALLWTLAAAMAGFGLLIALTAPFVAASIAIFGLLSMVVMLIYGTNFLSYHELIVAGEVLISAPSRVRRVISDEIRALDLAASVRNAKAVDEVATILSESATQFGFLGMELIGYNVTADKVADRILPADWGWRLDYPIRVAEDGSHPGPVSSYYVLSIWCGSEQGVRPYGAERIARVIGPALRQWFDSRHMASDPRSLAPQRPRRKFTRI